LTARYATQSNHSGIATSQKKTSRLPGPSRVPAAGSSTKVQGASNLNRRSQSFNSIDKNKPPQYANGNEKDSPKGPHPSAGMNGNVQHPTSTGQQQVSAIPSPSASKPWRSKSMNVKHSATSTMLSVKQPSPATSPTPSSDRLKPPPSEGVKPPSSGQKSMLEKFKLVNARTALRPPMSLSSGPSDSGREDDTFSECGEMDVLSGGVNSGGSTSSSPKVSPKLTPPKAGSKNLSNKKSLLQPKDKEEKNRDKNKVCTEKIVKEEKDQVTETSTKKSSKIASLIPKGSKTTAAKKESLIPSSSGIPKPGSKVPTAKQSTSSTCTGSKEVEKLRTTKGNQSQSTAKSQLSEKASPSSGLASSEGREPSAALTQGSSAALSASMAASSSQGTGNGVVQLPQQQQYSHPNTATVAPFIYRTLSENDSTSLPPADSCTSPTKMDLSFSKTAKQCLEEISEKEMKRVDAGAASYPHEVPTEFRCHSCAWMMVCVLCTAGAGCSEQFRQEKKQLGRDTETHWVVTRSRDPSSLECGVHMTNIIPELERGLHLPGQFWQSCISSLHAQSRAATLFRALLSAREYSLSTGPAKGRYSTAEVTAIYDQACVL
ncbi:PREDICTED: neuron navigator 3-like, partial [Chlamydotis macqueenii]|uniref:neuron navigator 3-like n=1 Tax=Chlamydotis macqueenii TaxID=187382 RepID=UPI000529E680